VMRPCHWDSPAGTAGRRRRACPCRLGRDVWGLSLRPWSPSRRAGVVGGAGQRNSPRPSLGSVLPCRPAVPAGLFPRDERGQFLQGQADSVVPPCGPAVPAGLCQGTSGDCYFVPRSHDGKPDSKVGRSDCPHLSRPPRCRLVWLVVSEVMLEGWLPGLGINGGVWGVELPLVSVAAHGCVSGWWRLSFSVALRVVSGRVVEGGLMGLRRAGVVLSSVQGGGAFSL
jgi:hypothetical protein